MRAAATDGPSGVPRAKIAVPRLPPRHVHRPRLLAVLEGAAPGAVVVVCAPAGHGKSLLLAEWAAQHPNRTAWVTLDAGDDDHRFWSAVVRALTSCPALLEDSPLRELPVPRHPSQDPEFLAAVVDSLDGPPASLCLVLDDVHELTAADPLHGLAALVRDRPPALQLVLAGRVDPPLPIDRMRLAGELCEVRVDALRFSAEETHALLTSCEVEVRPDQAQHLLERTEGWAAGLKLAALSLRDVDGADRFLDDIVGNGHAIADYLAAEVLSRLPVSVVDVLRAVSVCDEVSAPLAVAVSGRADAADVLDALEHDTSLVVSSGQGRLWYRVHPLLRAHLLAEAHRLRPDAVQALHGRAAQWYASRGRVEEALWHTREAGDREGTALLLRRHTVALLADGRHGVLRDALAWLGERHLVEDAWCSLVAAFVELESGDLAAADVHLMRADASAPAEPGPDLLHLRALVRARRAGATGEAADMILATEALPTTGDVPELAVLGALGALDRAMALLTADRRDEADVVAVAAMSRASELGKAFLVARGSTVLAALSGVRGDFLRMADLAEQADAHGRGTDWPATSGAAFTSSMRGYAALLRMAPDDCLDLLAPARRFYESEPAAPANPLPVSIAAFAGAALADLGRLDGGLEQLRRARTAALGTPMTPSAAGLVALLEHGVASRNGHHEAARAALGWAETILGDSGDLAFMRAQRLAVLGRHRAAAEALRPVLDGRHAAVVPWVPLAGWVLDCWLAVLGGQRSRARSSLDRALRLTEHLGALRPLGTAPQEVVDLLARQLGSFGALEATAQRLLDARSALGTDDHPVALTERERTVLRLLSTHRPLDEIADALTVSHSTVKTHVRAIYGKLGVNTRREAVDLSRRYGLVAEEFPLADGAG